MRHLSAGLEGCGEEEEEEDSLKQLWGQCQHRGLHAHRSTQQGAWGTDVLGE